MFGLGSAPKALGSDRKTHLESRCCAILMHYVVVDWSPKLDTLLDLRVGLRVPGLFGREAVMLERTAESRGTAMSSAAATGFASRLSYVPSPSLSAWGANGLAAVNSVEFWRLGVP